MEAMKPDGSPMQLTQIHFTGWPDHEAPNLKSIHDFEVMMNYFLEWTIKSNDEEKAVVHCSAGIGRTGTTIGIMENIIDY